MGERVSKAPALPGGLGIGLHPTIWNRFSHQGGSGLQGQA
jgi:hypothetical protein